MTSTPNTILNYQHDALGLDDAVGLCLRIQNKEISAAELCAAALKRAAALNPLLHCLDYSLKPDTPTVNLNSSGFFNGIPSFIKDNLSVQGMPTGFGTQAFPACIARKDSPYTQHFKQLGFKVLGKSTLPEFGLNASTEPVHSEATRNPWNLDYSAGASSGGAGALVASGIAPIAHGNDGGGSIRIPAACCGLVGLKPSRDRHINEPVARHLPINIISEGVLTRSVRDTAYYHLELQNCFRSTSLPFLPLVTHPGKRRLNIGMFIDSINGQTTDSETRAACELTAKNLREAGHYVEEMPFPVALSFSEDFAAYWGMLAFMIKHTGKLSLNRAFKAKQLDDLTLGLASYYQKRMLKTPQFLKNLKAHAVDFQEHFSRYDLYLSPVLGQTPRPIGELRPNQPFDQLIERLRRYACFTPMANIAGTPAISLPAGRTHNGVPIGIQLSAAMGNEQTLLEVAYELEEINPWPQLAMR